MMSPGKTAGMIISKYHDRGYCTHSQSRRRNRICWRIRCYAGILEYPHGKSDVAAALRNSWRTGRRRLRHGALDRWAPSNAEIAFEGFIHPNDTVQEGPLGEWTGYYASGSALEPAIRIATMMHRNDPILTGAIPAVPPNEHTFLSPHPSPRRGLESARSCRYPGSERRMGA